MFLERAKRPEANRPRARAARIDGGPATFLPPRPFPTTNQTHKTRRRTRGSAKVRIDSLTTEHSRANPTPRPPPRIPRVPRDIPRPHPATSTTPHPRENSSTRLTTHLYTRKENHPRSKCVTSSLNGIPPCPRPPPPHPSARRIRRPTGQKWPIFRPREGQSLAR